MVRVAAPGSQFAPSMMMTAWPHQEEDRETIATDDHTVPPAVSVLATEAEKDIELAARLGFEQLAHLRGRDAAVALPRPRRSRNGHPGLRCPSRSCESTRPRAGFPHGGLLRHSAHARAAEKTGELASIGTVIPGLAKSSGSVVTALARMKPEVLGVWD